MRFGSVCSGIEAASVAWEPLGWTAAWLAEIEPFPSAVLAHHYPDVPNLGDMTVIPGLVDDGLIEAPDVFCGGTPCQAFSVAGLRRSLDDARGNLSLVFCEIANAIDRARAAYDLPASVVFWENVPGVLSTKDNAFGCFLAGLAGEDEPLQPAGPKWTDCGVVLGPQRAVAWRVLDAQYFGLAQRRRRVFVVASARTDFDPVAVLLEFDGVRRDLAPSREARQGTAASAARCAGGSERCAGGGERGGLGVAQCLTTGTGKRYDPETETLVAHTLKGEGFDASEDGTGRGTPLVPVTFECGGIGAYSSSSVSSPLLRTGADKGAGCEALVAFHHNAQAAQLPTAARDTSISDALTRSQEAAVAIDTYNQTEHHTAHTIRSGAGLEGVPATYHAMQVRRLTPRECERLQGFPDDYTLIPWRKKPAAECPDGPRYKALGNSWAVPVVRWIGQRIAAQLEGVA